MNGPVILNYQKMLKDPNTNKDTVLKSFLSYILDRNINYKEIAMLLKLIKDFGHDAVFEALVALRYSNVDLSGNFWGFVIHLCKNYIQDDSNSDEEKLLNDTYNLLSKLGSFKVDNQEERKAILEQNFL